MASDKKTQSAPAVAEAQHSEPFGFLDFRKLVGLYIRQWREQSGATLRQLEARSGVSNSEISKVESGSQDCRLESFIRICIALGVPCGYILDHVVIFDFTVYEAKIKTHPVFEKIFKDHPSLQGTFAANIAIFAAFAAQLVLATRPMLKAARVEYPDPELRSAFLAFADRIERLSSPTDRIALLNSLKDAPLDSLIRHGLFNLRLLFRLLESSSKGISTTPFASRVLNPTHAPLAQSNLFWMPFIPPENIVEQNSHLTDVHALVNTQEMKAQWPILKKRLQKATTAINGGKTRLAEFLNVKLASVSQWLTDSENAREPGAETTLRMLQWVERQERKQ